MTAVLVLAVCLPADDLADLLAELDTEVTR